MNWFRRKNDENKNPTPSTPKQATCKRCRVVYEPRSQNIPIYMGGVYGQIYGVATAPFKSDEWCLLPHIVPQDYCPRCEEHLGKARERMVKALTPSKQGNELSKVRERLIHAQATINKQGNELGELRKQVIGFAGWHCMDSPIQEDFTEKNFTIPKKKKKEDGK